MDSPSKFGFNTPDFDALRISTETSPMGTDRPRRSTRSGVSTLSGTSTVFNTAVTSASDGSVGGALEPNDRFVGLKDVADSSLLCCMFIPKSRDQRVCVKPKSECNAISHVKCAELEDNSLYVCPRKDQILIGNCLATMWLSKKELDEAMENKQSKPLWFTYFDRVKDSQAWESVNTPTSQITLEEAVQGEEDLKSPRKVKLSEFIPEFKDDDVAVEEILGKPKHLHRLAVLVNEKGEIPKDLEELVRQLVFDWTAVQSNFDALECREDVGRSNLANLKTVLEDVITNTENKFNLIDTKARIIMNLIGNDDEASVNGELSIWKAIRAVQVDLAEMKKSLDFDILQLDSKYFVRWQKAEAATNVNEDSIKHNKEFLTEFKAVFEMETQKIFGMMSHLVNELNIAKSAGMNHSGMHNAGIPNTRNTGTHNAGIPNARNTGTNYAGMNQAGTNQAGMNAGMNQAGMNANSIAQSQFSQIEGLLQGLIDNDPTEKVKDLTNRVTLLERQLIGLVGIGNASGLPTGNNSQSTFRERTTNWAGGFADLNTAGFNPNSNVDGLRDRGGPSGQTSDQFKGMQKDIDLLRKGMEELQKKAKGEGYKSPSFHFHNFNEGMEFVRRTNLDIGYFWDIFSVLVAMLARRLEAKELSDFKYSAARTSTTKRTSRLEATMSSRLPKVFFGETADGQPKNMKEGMANCKSWNDWQGTQEPFKEFCTTELNTFIEGVQGDLPELSDEPDPDKRDGIRLAIHLLTQVQVQWTHLVGYIQSAYNDLLCKGGFSEKTAWILVGRYVAAIFNAMTKSRNKSRSLDDSTTLRGKATLFWSVLQCHRIMQEFIDAEFSRHPLIVKETSFFTLIDRVSAEELKTFKREVEKQFEGSNKRIKVLEDGGVSRNTALASQDSALASRVTDLESKLKDVLKNYSSLLNQYNQLKTRLDNKVDKK